MNRFFKSPARWVVLSLCLTAVVQGQSLPFDPAVKVGKLPNGFTYYIRRNAQPQNRVTFYLANRVGSILEEENERGLAHFLEHMNFNGTKHFPKNELINTLEKSGVKFGADLNAYTGTDETIYQLPIPSDDPALLEKGLLIMRDWTSEASLEKEEFEKERGVILEEKRLGQNASQRMRDVYLPVLLNHSRYAERLPIGLDEVIKGASVETIRKFYKKWYRPDLQALIVVGDVDVSAMEARIQALFGNLKKPSNAPVRQTYGIPLQKQASFVKVTDGEYPQTTIQLMYKNLAVPAGTKEAYRQSLLQRLTNVMMTQRFTEINQQSNPSFIAAKASAGEFMGNLNTLTAVVTLKPGQIEKGFTAFYREMLRLQEYGFDASEVTLAKERLQNQWRSIRAEQDKIPSSYYAEKYVNHFTQGEAAMSLTEEEKLLEALLPTLTPDVFREYIRSYLQQADQTTLVLGTAKNASQLPDQQQLESWKKTIQTQKRTPYQSNQSQGALLTQIPQAGKVSKEEYLEKIQLQIWTLGNGIKVVLKPTKFQNQEVLFTSFSAGGTSLYELSDYPAASQAAILVSSSGVGTLSSTQLATYMQRNQLQVKPYITDRYQGMSGATITRNLEKALQLVYGYVQEPRMDTVRLANVLDRSKAALAAPRTSPEEVFADTIAAVLSGHNPRRKPLEAADLEQLKAERLLEIYKERFTNGNPLTFVFTGSFDPDSLKPLVEQYLGALPPVKQTSEARDLNIRVPQGKIRKDVYAGEGNKASIQLVISGNYTFNAENNLALKVLRTVISYRLLERIREQEGGAYSPSVHLTTSYEPIDFYAFSLMFGCEAGRVDALVKATLEECEKIRNQGIRAEELEKFKAEEKRAHELELQSNSYWLTYLTEQLKSKESFTQAAEYNAQVEALTAEYIKKKAAEYLALTNVTTFTLRPVVK